MKKIKFTFLSLLAFSYMSQAQYVGDPSVYSVDFTNSSLLYMGSSQGYPEVISNSDVNAVVWSTNTQPVLLRHTDLNASYLGTTSTDVLTTTGNQNTTSGDLQHAICYDTISNTYLSVYKHNFYQGATKDYSMQAVLYDGSTFPATPFYIEGPFQYSSDAPSMPSIAVSSNSIYCIAYHSSLTSGSTSIVKVKFVNANTGVVTPVATSGTQNGIELTFQGAQHPSVAWNEAAGVFGITYTTGSGNNQKIKFVSCDESGNVVTAQKDLVADNQIQVQYPKLYADGNDFVMIWRDYRQIQIGEEAPVSGIPAMRIAQVDATGNLKTLSGAADIFDVNDNSLILSNPYMTEVYYEYDMEVIVPGQKYAVTWGTQNVVPSIEYSTVEVLGANIKASIAKTISNSGANSFGPSIAYDEANSKYLIAYYEHNGTNYENRITVGVTSTQNQVGIQEINENIFSIYPNPVNNELTIEGDVTNAEVSIYNISGQLVLSKLQLNNTINVSDLKPGLYILKIQNNNEITTIKFSKN